MKKRTYLILRKTRYHQKDLVKSTPQKMKTLFPDHVSMCFMNYDSHNKEWRVVLYQKQYFSLFGQGEKKHIREAAMKQLFNQWYEVDDVIEI